MTKSLSVVVLIASFCLGWTSKADAGVVTDWYGNALRCVFGGPAPAGPPANRPGPTGSLDLAVVTAAMHDAVQAIEGRYEPYHYSNPDMRDVGSPEAAAAAAAYGVLAGLYGADDPCLLGITDPATTYAGDAAVLAGQEAAAALLPLYRPTFASPIDPFIGSTEPGQWRPTSPGTSGANTFMAYTEPFALKWPSQFRPQRQPPMNSTQYSREFEEVRNYGSATGSMRTPEQTDLARFWGNPLGGMTLALRTIVADNIQDTGEQARVLALANLVTADGQIAVYDTKYHFNFWRPLTAIREADEDGNPETVGDPAWASFAPTPPYPDYSSGANCLAAGILTTLQLYFGTDEFEFSIPSAVPNLTTNPRLYERFSDAMQDMVDVRIYQGIHFRSADEEGRRQGARIAHWTFQKFLRPVRGRR